MRILGISAFYHDSAAALVEDGHIIAAAQEERFTRKNRMRATRRMLFAIVSRRAPCPSTSLTISCSTRSRF